MLEPKIYYTLFVMASFWKPKAINFLLDYINRQLAVEI